MTNRPSLRQLEYLVAVADQRHFRRAAEACFVTQPALSAQIQGLERLLGVQLFERDRRRVLPTPAGDQAVRRAREVLAQVDLLVEEAGGHRRPLAGPLRLGVIPTVAPYLLPRVLPEVRRAFPELRLLLREEQTERAVELLEAGRLDLLILALPVQGRELETAALLEDPFLLALPDGHSLARRRRLRQEELAGEEVLLLEDGHCLRDQALEVCRTAGAREHADLRATSLGTLVQMVSSGIGVTLLPAMAAESEGRAEGLVLRPFASPAPSRTIGLAWRRSSARGKEYRLLGEALGKAAGATLSGKKA